MPVWSSSEAETRVLGARLADAIYKSRRAPVLVSLKGDLGAGKSALARGLLARWLELTDGLTTAPNMPSPTYTIAQVYGVCAPVAHLDLYRLKSSEELEHAGGIHYFHEQSLCLVEWLDLIPGARNLVPEDAIEVHISGAGTAKRQIQGSFITTPHSSLRSALEDEVRELFF